MVRSNGAIDGNAVPNDVDAVGMKSVEDNYREPRDAVWRSLGNARDEISKLRPPLIDRLEQDIIA
jgi:hypothetical protein